MKKTTVGVLAVAASAIAMFITFPIWVYMLYTILKAIDADNLTWFLFWVYLPFNMFVSFIGKLLINIDEN